MALTQRNRFAEIVQHNGGQLGGLLAAMREQTGESVGSSVPAR